ncbi:MAG: hypothetical protein ACE5FU_15225 [Nitrospinota bacterium]
MTSLTEYEEFPRLITGKRNERIFTVLEEGASAFENEIPFSLSLEELRKEAKEISRILLERRNKFVLLNRKKYYMIVLPQKPLLSTISYLTVTM